MINFHFSKKILKQKVYLFSNGWYKNRDPVNKWSESHDLYVKQLLI